LKRDESAIIKQSKHDIKLTYKRQIDTGKLTILRLRKEKT